MKRAKILALCHIRSANRVLVEVCRRQKHVRVTCQEPIENEQQGTATPTRVGKSEGLRQHSNTKEYSDRIEQLDFANVETGADKITAGTCSTHRLTESAPSQGISCFRDRDFLPSLLDRFGEPDLAGWFGPSLGLLLAFGRVIPLHRWDVE